MDEGVPSFSPGWQKEVFVDFFLFKTRGLFYCAIFFGFKLNNKTVDI